MKRVKRNCSIKFELVPHGSGWGPFESAERGEGATSSFDEELELLMFDM